MTYKGQCDFTHSPECFLGFCHVGPSAWNTLPVCLKNNALSLSDCRNQLKHFCFLFDKHMKHVRGFFLTSSPYAFVDRYLLCVIRAVHLWAASVSVGGTKHNSFLSLCVKIYHQLDDRGCSWVQQRYNSVKLRLSEQCWVSKHSVWLGTICVGSCSLFHCLIFGSFTQWRQTNVECFPDELSSHCARVSVYRAWWPAVCRWRRRTCRHWWRSGRRSSVMWRMRSSRRRTRSRRSVTCDLAQPHISHQFMLLNANGCTHTLVKCSVCLGAVLRSRECCCVYLTFWCSDVTMPCGL